MGFLFDNFFDDSDQNWSGKPEEFYKELRGMAGPVGLRYHYDQKGRKMKIDLVIRGIDNDISVPFKEDK